MCVHFFCTVVAFARQKRGKNKKIAEDLEYDVQLHFRLITRKLHVFALFKTE